MVAPIVLVRRLQDEAPEPTVECTDNVGVERETWKALSPNFGSTILSKAKIPKKP